MVKARKNQEKKEIDWAISLSTQMQRLDGVSALKVPAV